MEKKNKKRTLEGVVVSDKMDKTCTVAVTRLKKHGMYHKYFKTTKKYKAHDEENTYKIGDNVVIEETNPVSKDKRWKVAGMVKEGK